MKKRDIYLYLLILSLILIYSTNIFGQINYYGKVNYNTANFVERDLSSSSKLKINNNQPPIIRASNPLEDAQFIRDNAGVPKNEITGVQNDKKPGIEGFMEDSERIEILSYNDAESKCSSGSGTRKDPFIIENKRLNNSENSQNPAGIYIFDLVGNYNIHIKNCEISGYNYGQIYINIGADVIISNCNIYTKDYGIIQKNGNLEVLETHFSGLEKGGISASSGQRNSLVVRNSLFNSHSGDWGNYSKGIFTNGTGLVSISYSCVENVDSLTFIYIFKTTRLIFRNCYINNISIALYRGNDALGFISDNSDIRFLEIKNTYSTSISLLGESNLEISYCSVSNSAPNNRLILISNSDHNLPENIRVHHCKFTDSVGSHNVRNECVEVFCGKNIEFDHNWVTQCSEDAYELAYPQKGCSIHHNVGDNVSGQIVDIYLTCANLSNPFSPGGYVGTYIHHIYGNSINDCAVRITDADGVVIHDIYAKCGAIFSVILEQRHGEIGKTPANCKIFEPIVNFLSDNSTIGLEGTIGPGNLFINISTDSINFEIIDTLIFLNGKLFEVSVINVNFSYISILKFLGAWNIFSEPVIEWVEESDDKIEINYTIDVGRPFVKFILE